MRKFYALMWKKVILSCSILVFLLGISFSQALVTIDMETEYQRIDGFGGIVVPWWGVELTDKQAETAFNNEPGDLGFSILRLRIPFDENEWSSNIANAQIAKSYGVTVIASPWNPPADLRMEVDGQRRLDTAKYSEYTDHLLEFKDYMADNGVPLYAISIQNEPDYAHDWTEWNATEMINYLIQEGSKFTDIKMIAPESFQFRKPFSDAILNNSEAAQHVDIIGGHLYGSNPYYYPEALAQNKDIWMTEHYTSSNQSANLWPEALEVGEEIHDCMKSSYNAYIWWTIRRFYGPMTDDGLISKRGYMMAQYAKFIRPGFIRCGTEISGSSNVELTSYKTDSSLVIVVFNDNNTKQELEIDVQTDAFSEITQFTTSEFKNLFNDSVYTIVDSVFTATVEPKSITTFTTYPDNGMHAGNQVPDAEVGEDYTIVDTNNVGSFQVTLDASGSSDPDGEIVEYVWSYHVTTNDADSKQLLSNNISVNRTLGVGEHEYFLTVIDDDGAIGLDTINISIHEYTEPTGISTNNSNNDFIVFPNPADETITINLDAYTVSNAEIRFFNIQGHMVKVENATSQNPVISVTDLAEGMYFIQMVVNHNVLRTRFTKK